MARLFTVVCSVEDPELNFLGSSRSRIRVLKAAPALSVEIKLLFYKIGGINLPELRACCDRI